MAMQAVIEAPVLTDEEISAQWRDDFTCRCWCGCRATSALVGHGCLFCEQDDHLSQDR